jgi:alanine racemase
VWGEYPVTQMVSATIDLGALRHNLQVVRRLAPKSKVMAVIKANAYGHGLITVARALESADALAIARLHEGLALRDAGIKNRIVLLEGFFDREQLEAAAAANLEAVVHAWEQIELLQAADAPTAVNIWLKLDSGMNRLGFKSAAFHEAYAALRALPALRGAVTLMTHLASPDQPELPTTAEQLTVFGAATRALDGERSMGSSAAILRFPESHADWVRPGIMLYGISPLQRESGAQHDLKPVMTLSARVIAVKDVAEGEQVGYGGDWTATRPTRLAIASIGYGDGYPRSASSGTPILVNGEMAALAGRVSMDMIAIDVTENREAVRVGDPVVLWGEGLPVEEIALWSETNPYELVCGITSRVSMTPRE